MHYHDSRSKILISDGLCLGQMNTDQKSIQFSGLKEQFLFEFALRFQQAGYTTLVYDNRNWGESEGKIRNETNPLQSVHDYYDAFDYAASLPDVDSSKIVYWGSSLSGGVVIQAAGVDTRICGVIAQAPFVSAEIQVDPMTAPLVPALFQDRAAVRAGQKSTMIPVYPESIEEAVSGNSQAVIQAPDVFSYVDECRRRGITQERWVTGQTVLNLKHFEPKYFLHKISPNPILMIVAENDTTTSSESQLEAFELAKEPKSVHVIKDVGHFDIYFGPAFEENIQIQLNFLNTILAS